MEKTLLKYNGVVVIQSLPQREIQTGKELFDAIISRRCSQMGKAGYYYEPNDRHEFFDAINEMRTNVIHW